ncbi:ABC-type amino acid transport system, permease component [Caballeronia sordidicola]|uniref:ABC-type amino acid transport system, permease component n=2 Tax=Burkholderiales TaxID=80840 RepID=A0A242MH38_CABSO|nr:ABC-type amino acid transport system, permease component [Caballeronia sordidicola]
MSDGRHSGFQPTTGPAEDEAIGGHHTADTIRTIDKAHSRMNQNADYQQEQFMAGMNQQGEPPADLRIHARPKKSDWLWYGLFAIAMVLFYQLVIDNPRWQWDVVAHYLFNKRVLGGLANTLVLTALASVLGLILGAVIAACRMADNLVLRAAGYFYIWIIRATPTLAMLLFLFFLSALVPRLYLPIPFLHATLFDIDTNTVISRFSAAIIGLAMYLGGHSAEIFRGGLASVDKGQREACKAMGMSDFRMMFHVVVPQAVRIIIPPLANELITMFKNTSLASVIGYVELLTTVQLIYSTNFETIPLLTVACLWYLVLTSLAMCGQSLLERRFGKGV